MAVAAGSEHTAAVGDDGVLFVWGGGEHGELGIGSKGGPVPRPRWAPRWEPGPVHQDSIRRTSREHHREMKQPLLALTPTRINLPAVSMDGSTMIVGRHGVFRRCRVRQIAAGARHTGIVTDAGDLLMCGSGEDGRLGLGDKSNRMTPTLLKRVLFDGFAVLMVACGREHTAVVTEVGAVYTFGGGLFGRLGHGGEQGQLVPRQVLAVHFNGERVVMVAAGNTHTVALSEEGHVYTWGNGGCGQLGHDEVPRTGVRTPRKLDRGWFGGEEVVFVAAGGNHTVAVRAGGGLVTWGEGCFGKLGHDDTGNRPVPTLVGAGAFGGSAVVMAACGPEHTLAVPRDGTLWACGRGSDGRLGLDDERDRHVFQRVGAGEFGEARIVSAAAGLRHSVAVTEDGTLWTWGANETGRLGHGDEFMKEPTWFHTDERSRWVPRTQAFHNERSYESYLTQHPWPADDRWVPAQVARASFGDVRIGRCRALPAEHALAFAMGTHWRLGAASPVRCLAGEVGLLRMIAGWCRRWRWVSGAAGREEGVMRLLGGGRMLDS